MINFHSFIEGQLFTIYIVLFVGIVKYRITVVIRSIVTLNVVLWHGIKLLARSNILVREFECQCALRFFDLLNRDILYISNFL